MKKTLAMLLTVVMIFVLCACGQKTSTATTDTSAPTADGEIVIAALMNNLADTNTAINAKGIEDKGAELGITVKINDGRNDLSTQISQAEDMIAQGVDAIILHAISAEGSSVVVDKCNEAGIPCVVMNLAVESEDYSAYVGVYDVYAGEMMGERVTELLGGEGKIV
ncbi:MAG: sugar ABC transporter substrate-binding protein, partial [Acholeplasmataceae bacterium]|nr:sugar ABC transporter substrate-binding protein [Acholeplasmataceae bacterium]